MKKTVLVTGANGFIGSGLCKYFSDRGYEVYGLVRESSDLYFLEGIRVTLIYGDLKTPEKIRFPEKLDCFVHNASIVSDNANAAQCKSGILDLTVNLVDELKKYKIGRFIYISSTLTLGYGKEKISETNPGLSCDFLPYALSKKQTERFLKDRFQNDQFPLVIIRPGDVYGPKDRTSCVQMLKAADQGVPLIIGRGDKKFPMCYIDNLSQAVYLAAEKPDVIGRSFSVTNGADITWKEFFKGFYTRLGKKQRLYIPRTIIFFFALLNQFLLKIFPNFNAPVNLYRIRRISTDTTYDISETIRELGYQPDVNHTRQIKKIVDWYFEEKEKGRLKYY